MTGIDTTDVRNYSIHAVVKPEGRRTDLEFQGIARQTLMQEIPFVNSTFEDWTLRATFMGNGFYGPFSVLVKASSTQSYPISFRPLKSGDYTCNLILTNMQTSQKLTVNLKGSATDPIAEESRVLNCRSRQILIQEFPVSNLSDQDVVYEVVHSIPFAEGSKTFKVPLGKTLLYKMTIKAKLSGSYPCKIQFINKEDGSFIFYDILVLFKHFSNSNNVIM